MLLAVAIAVLAVGLGLALGLVPSGRARIAGPLRTFALSAALTVVLTHLLPEAFGALGTTALVLFALAGVVPAWIRNVRPTAHDGAKPERAHAGLTAGYLGLLVHHVGDGLGLGAYTTLPGGAAAHADVLVALAVHTVPLVAVVAFAFRAVAGTRVAVQKSAGLAAASVAGVLSSALVSPATAAVYSAWIAALVAGLLVHVVTHDLERDLPADFPARSLDAFATLLGIASCWVAAHSAEPEEHALAAAYLGEATRAAVPLVVAGALLVFFERKTSASLRFSLERAFGPTFGIDGAVLAFALVGGETGLLYLGGVALFSAGLGMALGPQGGRPMLADSANGISAFDAQVQHVVPWILTAFALAALVTSCLSPEALRALPRPAALALVLFVALPVRMSPGASLIVAAALQSRGLAPEAAFAFAFLAPAPTPGALVQLARQASTRAAVRLALVLGCVALVIGLATLCGDADALEPPRSVSLLALVVLSALALRATFQRGVRGLLLAVFPSHDSAAPADAGSLEAAPVSAR